LKAHQGVVESTHMCIRQHIKVYIDGRFYTPFRHPFICV
jgi:hypothetical protein